MRVSTPPTTRARTLDGAREAAAAQASARGREQAVNRSGRLRRGSRARRGGGRGERRSCATRAEARSWAKGGGAGAGAGSEEGGQGPPLLSVGSGWGEAGDAPLCAVRLERATRSGLGGALTSAVGFTLGVRGLAVVEEVAEEGVVVGGVAEEGVVVGELLTPPVEEGAVVELHASPAPLPLPRSLSSPSGCPSLSGCPSPLLLPSGGVPVAGTGSLMGWRLSGSRRRR